MTTATPITLHAELRAAVGKGFPPAPGLIPISEKRQGYKGETPLNEYRVTPHFTGSYADVNAEAHARNAAMMPYQHDDSHKPVIPVRFYAHPIPKEV